MEENKIIVDEGNNVSSNLTPALDSFLQDVAQMTEVIDYTDIVEFGRRATETEIKKLTNLRKRWIAEAEYNDDESEETLKNLADKVAVIVKSNITEDVDVGVDSHTETIYLTLEMSRLNEEDSFDYHVEIDDVGQIVFTPNDSAVSFVDIERLAGYDSTEDVIQGNTRRFAISLTTNMLSDDDNFDWFCDIDEIGQAVITPDSESTSFLTASVNDSLDLVTQEKELIEAIEEPENTTEENDEESETTAEQGDKEPETIEPDVEAEVVDEAYETDTIYDQLKKLTFNFSAVKGELRSVYKSEVDSAAEALAREYDTVNTYESGEWYVVEYADKKQKITEDIDQDEFQQLKDLTDLIIQDLEKLLTDAANKVDALERNFRKMGINTCDLNKNFKQKIQAFINSTEDISLEQLKSRVKEYEQSLVEESLETLVPDKQQLDDVERSTVIHRFMTGELPPIQSSTVDANLVELTELNYNYNEEHYRYFYDKERDSIVFTFSKE